MQKPKLFSILKHRKKELDRSQLIKDIVSGIIVAIIALPLSVALGISSGVSPEKGLITAIIAGFFVSFLGGSRVQIGGPTGAFVVIVYGIIEKYGIEGLTIATMMAGAILILLGLLKFGDMIKFIPCTITTGFTTGIAIVLLSTQIKDFLGLKIDKVPSEFIPKWGSYVTHLNTINWATFAVGLASLLIIIYWPRVSKTIPGSLIALIAATLAVKFMHLPVETIGDRFGHLSSTLPVPRLTPVDGSTFLRLISPAVTIAALGGIESLLSAVVADGMIGKKHNSNMELIAQGTANIAAAAFGGIPATGAIARTAANIRNGGRTPIAGIVHAITLLLIMVIFMPLAQLIPMTSLGAILIMVSYNMSDLKEFKHLLKAPKSDIAVLLITFLFTVVFDLVVAIGAGMVVAMLLFIKKMSESTKVYDAKEPISPMEDMVNSMLALDNDSILVYEIEGPLFFGAAQGFADTFSKHKDSTEVLILRMRNVHYIDATACAALKRINAVCTKNEIALILSGVQQQPMKVINNMGLAKHIGADRIFNNFDDSLAEAKMITSEKEEITA